MDKTAPDMPDAATLERLALQAVERLPEMFRVHLTDVVFRVLEFADSETLAELGIDDPLDLSGLYEGLPVGEHSIWESGAIPPVITLYRAALLDEWVETGVDLEDLITHVIVHEVGHHFGFSDEDMEIIEDDAP
jgi:predicted Zn-dependent protease with MMP-like domain